MFASPVLALLDDPTRSPPWEWQQWAGFAIYGVLILGLAYVAWRLAAPSASDGDDPPQT